MVRGGHEGLSQAWSPVSTSCVEGAGTGHCPGNGASSGYSGDAEGATSVQTCCQPK